VSEQIDLIHLERVLASPIHGPFSMSRGRFRVEVDVDDLNVTRVAARAYLASAARFKEIDVWHLEFVSNGVPCIDHPFTSRILAELSAKIRREDGRDQCIRVTGPHKQRVPA